MKKSAKKNDLKQTHKKIKAKKIKHKVSKLNKVNKVNKVNKSKNVKSKKKLNNKQKLKSKKSGIQRKII